MKAIFECYQAGGLTEFHVIDLKKFVPQITGNKNAAVNLSARGQKEHISSGPYTSITITGEVRGYNHKKKIAPGYEIFS
jgi:hypothetical protein